MTRKELKVILDKHNLWLEEKEGGARADLSGADLQVAALQVADLKGADLSNANLSNANLEYADLEYANLEDVNLKGANLKGANLHGANLKHAYLEFANLKYADLEYANLKGANLKGAIMPEGFKVEQKDSKINNLEKLQAARVAYDAAHVSCEVARFSYESEIEATLSKVVEALAGVDRFVKDLAPYADTSYPLVPSLARACEIYAELKGETE